MTLAAAEPDPEAAKASAAPRPAAAHDPHADATHAARSVLLQILAALGQIALPVYQALIARLFGQAIHGLYVSSITWTEVLTRTALVGADKGMFRFIAAHRAAGNHDQATAALGSGLRLGALGATLLAVGVVVLAGPIANRFEPGLTVPMRLMAPTIIASTLMMVLVAAALGARTSRVSLIVRGVAEPGLLILAALGAWSLGAGLGGLALAHTVAYTAVLVVAVVAVQAVFGRGELGRALRAPGQPGFVAFTFPLGLSETMNVLLQRADVLMMPLFLDVKVVAVYFTADMLARSAAGLRPLFDGVVGPVISEALALHQRERLRYNLQLITRWVALASAPIAATLIALSPDILSYYGSGYRGGANALTLLVLGHMVNGIIGSTPAVLTMSGRSRQFFWNNLGAAILNVTLNLLLIPRFGIVGAAASAFLSVSCLQGALAIQVWLLERVHPLSPQLLKPLAAAAVVLLYGLAMRAVPLPVPARAALVVLGAAVIYLAANVLLGLAAEERRIFERVVARLSRRRAG